MENKYILMVDDEQDVIQTVATFLTPRGYTVNGANDSTGFFDLLEKDTPDLVLLDIKLPGDDGVTICKKMKDRDKFSDIPVIMLSANDAENDKVNGLDIGADDYVTKPFSLQELHARIRAVLRRKDGVQNIIDVNDEIKMNIEKCEVTVNGENIELTSAEFRILEFLACRKGKVFSRDRILDYLWGEEKIVVARTVDVHIRHIREKLGKYSDIIQNVRGFGYKVSAE